MNVCIYLYIIYTLRFVLDRERVVVVVAVAAENPVWMDFAFGVARATLFGEGEITGVKVGGWVYCWYKETSNVWRGLDGAVWFG